MDSNDRNENDQPEQMPTPFDPATLPAHPEGVTRYHVASWSLLTQPARQRVDFFPDGSVVLSVNNVLVDPPVPLSFRFEDGSVAADCLRLMFAQFVRPIDTDHTA